MEIIGCGLGIVAILKNGSIHSIPSFCPITGNPYISHFCPNEIFNDIGKKLAALTQGDVAEYMRLYSSGIEQNAFFDTNQTFDKPDSESLIACIKTYPGCPVTVTEEVWHSWLGYIPPILMNSSIDVWGTTYHACFVTGEGSPLVVGLYLQGEHKLMGLPNDAVVFPKSSPEPIQGEDLFHWSKYEAQNL